MELPADAMEGLLARWPVARLVTLRRDGSPAPVPVVFAVASGRLWSPVDAKPKRHAALARLRHVARDPRVSLLLDGYAEDWELLWWLRLDGRATVHRGQGPEDDPALAPAVDALRRKYPQYRETPLFRGEPTLLGVTVEAQRGWCASERALEMLRRGGT